MKRQHVTPPGPRAAAVTLLAARSVKAAEKVFCADAENIVVHHMSCDDAPRGTFFLFASVEEHAIGSSVDPKVVDLYDSADFIDRKYAKEQRELRERDLESRGFGSVTPRACGS
ncbi:primase zinc finger [Colletotrichum scovillei]|uniref:Primase zinc finger n=1 Tax=Colletotrichum scovillei TaxID=1209932 RepID=A0A9P7R1E1_9PEZI|nr:primase zinc finger [Colletotrichum scovillei]KAF4780810.1 primase zinc finger [Colletotrichum scovillei]KAG7045423.1 primase zinc finger [Colletotrichum scovillei]KAG7052585.1 primase zinc finger [Colletotrichum scovillei]KAG7064876.1 primase zinc finger [Colletotrichum scovillei]